MALVIGNCMSDGMPSTRRDVLKYSTVAISGLTTATTAASASVTRDKQAYIYGQTDINNFDSDYYAFAVDGDGGQQIAKYKDCEPHDEIREFTDKNGNPVDAAEGAVDKGKKDVYEYGSKFLNFYAYYGTSYDVECYGDFDTERRWEITFEGDGDYTVYFAGDYEPRKGNNMDGDETVGVNSIGSYVSGSTETGPYGSFDDQDSFTVWGDVKRIFVDNYGTFRIRATA